MTQTGEQHIINGGDLKMKKYVYILLILALLLSGCASKPAEQPAATTEPATIPTTAPTTAPTQATQPTTVTTTAPTTVPTAEPTTAPTATPTTEPTTPTTTEPSANLSENIRTFWYHGEHPGLGSDIDTSQCVVDCFYAFDESTQKIITVCNSPIVTYNRDDNFVYFVKVAEPTKIYAAPFDTLDQHRVLYETDGGAVTNVFFVPEQFRNQALQFVVDSKRHIWLDFATGETLVLMEQYYIEHAHVDTTGPIYREPVKKWQDYERIYFVGKLNENDKLNDYLYYRSTGEIEIWPY